jgi:hypothetical protein
MLTRFRKWISGVFSSRDEIGSSEHIVYALTDSQVENEIHLLQLGTGVYDTYLRTVKNKDHYTTKFVQKKLTRNVLLATPLVQKRAGQTLYVYGNLDILVVGDTIVWIRNRKGYDVRSLGWKKDKAEHKRLGDLLGI